MGNENINISEMDKIDAVSMKIDLAVALVDLLAETEPSRLDEKTIRNTAFHVRDLLEEVQQHHRLLSAVAMQK